MTTPASQGDHARIAYRAQITQILRDCMPANPPPPPTRAEQIGVLLRIAIEQLDRSTAYNLGEPSC
ncbi:MAG: hypothetical protein ACT4PG_09935 [Panacagrimonas sp.]